MRRALRADRSEVRSRRDRRDRASCGCRCRRDSIELDSRFDAMQQTMIVVGGGLIGVLDRHWRAG